MMKDINAMAEAQGWNQIKKARTVIAAYSIGKAAERVEKQKEEAAKESAIVEEEFN